MNSTDRATGRVTFSREQREAIRRANRTTGDIIGAALCGALVAFLLQVFLFGHDITRAATVAALTAATVTVWNLARRARARRALNGGQR